MAPRARAAATLLVVALAVLGLSPDAPATPSPTHAVAGAAQNTFGDTLAIAAVSGPLGPGVFWGGGVAVANGVPLVLDCVAVTTGFSNDHLVFARGTNAVLGTRYIVIHDYPIGSDIFGIATSPAPGGQFVPCGANVAGGGATGTGGFTVAP